MSKKNHIVNSIIITLFSISFFSFGIDEATNQNKSLEVVGIANKSKDSEKSGTIEEPAKYSDSIVVGNDFFVKEGKRFLDLSGSEIGVQSDYILKVGDVLVIDIWGDLDLHYSLTLNKDGFIVIPSIGRVDLQGLTFEEGKKKILNKSADTYGFYIDKNDPGAGKAHLDIALGKISGVKVYLTGEVAHPGVVMLNGANSSIIAAIAAGGGLSSVGSVRNIQIIHTDKQQSVFDLYNFLFKGKLSPENKYLRDGDTIYVPPLKSKAYALGTLVNPGRYEISDDETITSLINIAGGITSFSSGKIAVSSVTEDTYNNKNLNTENQEDISNVAGHKVKDNDIIIVREQESAKPYSYVQIIGKGVRYNGKLRYERDLTIKDYINRAGGLYRDAYKTIVRQSINEDGATYFTHLDLLNDRKNENIQLLPGDSLIIEDSETIYNSNFAFVCGYVENPKMLKLTGNERISDLITIGKPRNNANLESSSFIHNGHKISIDLEKIVQHPSLEINIIVQKQDVLYVPKREPYIAVTGAVLCPGFYPYSKNQTAKYYIDMAGGFSDNANRYKTIITNFTGNAVIMGYYSEWWFFSSDPIVANASKITVPEIRKTHE